MDQAEQKKIIEELAERLFSGKPVPGRASEPHQKQYILDRIFSVWCANPDMRLGQLLLNALGAHTHVDLFYTEDYELAANLESYYERRKTL